MVELFDTDSTPGLGPFEGGWEFLERSTPSMGPTDDITEPTSAPTKEQLEAPRIPTGPTDAMPVVDGDFTESDTVPDTDAP
jgi:hypothetical protein